MPELLIDFITSLDGYGAADGWPGWWGLDGPEYLAWLGTQPEADYTVLCRMHREPQNHPNPYLLGTFAVLETRF